MEINIGDKVKFLNEVGEGIIVKILSKTMVLIKNKDNFEYQYPSKELIVIKKAETQNINIESKKIVVEVPKEEKHYYNNSDISNIYFAFLNNKEENNFDFFLVNDSNYSFYYNIILFEKLKNRKIKHDYLEENSIAELETLTANEINNSKKIIIQLLFYNHPKNIYHKIYEKEIEIVPLNFWQVHQYIENDFFDENAYLVNIFNEDLKFIEKNRLANEKVLNILKEDGYEDKSRRFSSQKKKETLEIDLHITNLIDSVVGLSNSMILEIQMKVFHKALTDALINNNIEKLIIIHGIGSGTLKDMIRESITNTYKLKFEDASYREYGFGATMIIL